MRCSAVTRIHAIPRLRTVRATVISRRAVVIALLVAGFAFLFKDVIAKLLFDRRSDDNHPYGSLVVRVASAYWGKIYTVVDAIRLNRSDGALVRVVVPICLQEADDEYAAERAAREFVNRILPVLATHLDG
jgi:hypothetical protein